MSFEIPHFTTSVEDGRVIVAAESLTIKPAVVFDMLGTLALHGYNISQPKDENMYLRKLADRELDRVVATALPPPEARLRMNGLITYFDCAVQDLKDISERQYAALIDHSKRRIAVTGEAA